MSYRVDRGRLGAARIDHMGNLIVTGALTRTGVFTYHHIDGTVTRELRHEDDVYHPESVASFVQVPVTDEHPSEGRITPDNVGRYMVGNVGDTIKRDGRLMKADIFVRDAGTIAKVKGEDGKPKRELSCGYTADVVEDAGEYNGEKYDHRQTNIRGNHVAIVRAGRAGPEARLLLDSADAIMDGDAAWLEDELTILDKEVVEDAKGEGSRGGHIVGHTSSGKPVYSVHGHKAHKDFDAQDHYDAARLHRSTVEAKNLQHKQTNTLERHKSPKISESTHKKLGKIIDARDHHQKQEHKHLGSWVKLGGLKVTHPHIQDSAIEVNEDVTEDQAVVIAHSMLTSLERGDSQQTNAGGNRMKIIKDGINIGSGDKAFKLDKLELDIPDEAEAAVGVVLDQRDAMKEELDSNHTKILALQGKLDALEEQKKDWDNPAKQEAMAAVRQEIVATALHADFKQDDIKGKTNSEIKRMVVSARWPHLKVDELEDGYVEGRYGTVQDEAEAEGVNFQKMQDLGGVVNQHTDRKPPENINDVGDGEKTYRQVAAEKLDGLHNKTPEQMSALGL